MPAPAARIRSASVPCGVSSASIKPFSTYSVRTSRCEARVGAVKAQMTFLTWPLAIICPISGASAGGVAPPRVEFDTQVRFFVPCLATAPYRLIGIPTTANPPKPIVAPSGMSRTASSKLAWILLLALIPRPDVCLLSHRHHAAAAPLRQPRLIFSPLDTDRSCRRSCGDIESEQASLADDGKRAGQFHAEADRDRPHGAGFACRPHTKSAASSAREGFLNLAAPRPAPVSNIVSWRRAAADRA